MCMDSGPRIVGEQFAGSPGVILRIAGVLAISHHTQSVLRRSDACTSYTMIQSILLPALQRNISGRAWTVPRNG